MKRILFLIVIIITTITSIAAQKILTLKECYDLAMAANALSSEKSAYADISQLKEENLSKGWLPTLDANGSILYNSSVVDMSSALSAIPIPGIADAIKPLPHEQYKITIDVTQVIYDGGAIKNARNIEKADLKVNEKLTETDLYKLRSQINNYYFNLILLDRQKELLNNFNGLIKKRIASLQSALSNGVIIRTDIDVLTSERIKIEQQLTENEIRKISLSKILSDLTGTLIDTSATLLLPTLSNESAKDLLRPELQLFDLRRVQLEAGQKLVDSKRLPKAFGFATFGYGNPPGSNFFKDEFAPYYILGAGLKWNIFDWNKSKNEKQIISFQQGIVENRKKELSDNLNRLLEAKNAEIESLKKMLDSDNELITIRKRITASAESQYENGTITATEYLNELNSERQAIINYEIHKINLALAGVEYRNISGREID
jgi:outer membrane protein TolC